MSTNLLRLGLLLLVALAAWLPTASANKAAEASPKIPARLSERHPAVLSGRMDRKQTSYVDLYAPLTPAEARELAGYRVFDAR